MTEWYEGLEPLMKVFWGCAGVGSLFFLCQTIMSFIGADSDADVSFEADISGDMDGSTMSAGGVMGLFSIRGFINLLMGFGWTGVCCRSLISNDALLVLAAVLVGILIDLLCLFLMKKMLKLEHSGNVQPLDVIGCAASVYLRIPQGGTGKIQLSINGSVREYDAVAQTEIPTGKRVRVTELVSPGTYRVEII